MNSNSRTIPVAIALILALVGGARYCSQRQHNPITGEVQYVSLSPGQEVALGLHAAPQMAARFGGELRDPVLSAYVDSVGQRLLRSELVGSASPYRFAFHVLNDAHTINAFALPGGQVFITVALLMRMDSEAQLASVLGHEIGHVVYRHGAQHIAKQQLGQSLVTAVSVGSYDPNHPGSSRAAALLAQAGNQLISLRYGRTDELQSDEFGFKAARAAGYDPNGSLEVMQILERASGGGRQPEFLSTHPDPGNRRERLREMREEAYPRGVPSGLIVGRDTYARNVLAVLRGSSPR